MGQVEYLMKTFFWTMLVTTVVGLDAILRPQTAVVTEYGNITLNCTLIDATTIYNDSRWKVDSNDILGSIYYAQGTCHSILANGGVTNWHVECYGNNSFIFHIWNITRSRHGQRWKCEIASGKSNASYIYVKVPVKSVDIINTTGDIITLSEENSNVTLECKSSYSRPATKVLWHMRKAPSYDLQNITIKTSINSFNDSDDDDLVSVTSILHLHTNKSFNNASIYCSAVSNSTVQSKIISINFTYPPDGPPVIEGINNKDNYKIIENHNLTLYCKVNGGNPLASLNWNCTGNDFATDCRNDCSARGLIYIASKTKKTCACTARHMGSWSRSSTISFEVLYPPDINPLTNKNVTEGSDLLVECKFKPGNPRNTTVFWTRNEDNQRMNESQLIINNVTREAGGLYTCTVYNDMISTSDTSKTVRILKKSSFHLNVLYPPDINQLTNKNVTEGSDLSVECKFKPGNPRNTTVFWIRNEDNERMNESQLIINNVTRENDGLYTCTVYNDMISTSDTSKTVRILKNSSFYLNVLFPTSIADFYVDGKVSRIRVVVNETDTVSFICDVEANPASNITIRSPQTDRSVMSVHTNTITHTVYNATYVHAGVYTCVGSNILTNETSPTSRLSLIVRSYPRPASGKTNNEIVTSTLHAEVTMEFAAHDYLEIPNRTYFTWYKGNASIEANSTKFNTSSCGLRSSLTIFNITRADFAKYRVEVENSIGKYQHFYILKAKDIPDEPVNFMYVEDSISDSSVTLRWEPAFDGGYPQTFILNYKKITENKWQNSNISDGGSAHMIFTLAGLSSMTTYEVQMYAKNKVGHSSATDKLRFITKAAPRGRPIESPSASKIGIIAGSVSSTIIIVTVVSIIVAILIYRKRNNKETGRVYQNIPFSGNNSTAQRKREGYQIEETLFEGLQEVDDVPVITKERTEYCNSPGNIEKIDRIKVTELFSYVSGRSEESFEADYQKLPTELQKPCTFARKPENIALNRYNGIYPYDHSRVKLHGHPDFFINACYIDGYKSSKAYIASLGPTAKTTSDFETFWKMIWYERVDIIVMLTNLREPSGMKCEKYWPEGGASIWYGDVCVSSEATECFAEYTIRKFSVSKEEEHRSLTHLHYTAWPDKTVPEDVTSLIEFRQRMKTTPTSSEGPIVVHCSAGIGRTGTLIALDRLIKEGQDKGSLNVFECVDNMREQRVKMVQTFEQYMYIYKALVNALTFDCETIPAETFNEYVDATNNNLYSMMFQQLRQSVETDTKADVAVRLKNEKFTNKNRRGADIPGNRFRAMLYLNRTDEGSEYINAVYINSFVKKDYFIAAQSPLPCTVADFITLIYQEDCSCIATMEDLKDPGMTVGQYLPDDKKTLTVGNFKVSSSRLETKNNYLVREMKIKYSGKIDSGEKTIYHFQYTKWMTGKDTPADARDFVQFVNEVNEYANELGEEKSHVLVHCLKSSERSGLFCALTILMEKIKFERQVNVLNTLRHLRTRRQTAITSMEQLKFCYQATSAYIKMNKLG